MSKPNIILITTDQQRADTIQAAGADWMITPNLDKLATEGTLFTNAFCCAATCVSSRSALYTGLYPHTTGVYGFHSYRGRLNWTHRLKAEGYRTISIGKTHIDGSSHGFDQRIAEQGNKVSTSFCDNDDGKTRKRALWLEELEAAGYEPPVDLHKSDPDYWDKLAAVEWTLPDEWHFDVWMGQKAVDWIDDYQTSGRPLFLHIGFMGPHDLYDPPQSYIDAYDDQSIPMPHVTEQERAGMPDELWAENRRLEQSFGNDTVIHPERATPDRVRRMRKHYFANVSVIDEQVGRIVHSLDQSGLLENSLLIFTSDHGDNLFDHGLVYKGELYDTVMNIPMIIRESHHIGPSRTVTEIVSHLDMVKYLLHKAGVRCDDLNGVSLEPVVEQEKRHTRQYVYAEEGASGLRPEPELCAMIRSDTAKLIMFVGGTDGQLFDLEADPRETRNLWNRPETRELQSELTAALLTWLYRDLYRHHEILDPVR